MKVWKYVVVADPGTRRERRLSATAVRGGVKGWRSSQGSSIFVYRKDTFVVERDVYATVRVYRPGRPTKFSPTKPGIAFDSETKARHWDWITWGGARPSLELWEAEATPLSREELDRLHYTLPAGSVLCHSITLTCKLQRWG